MTKKQWQKIMAARDLLGLEDSATLAEIKQAYRRMSRKHHPDLAAKGQIPKKKQIEMHQIIAANDILMDYCDNYIYPLTLKEGDADSLEAEDWWMDRFGNDPLWGKESV